jgi:hypothetical protein
MTVEKHLGDIAVAAKSEIAGGVTALTTSGARSLALRYQSASNRYFGDNLKASVCASLLRFNHCLPEAPQQRPLRLSRADA